MSHLVDPCTLLDDVLNDSLSKTLYYTSHIARVDDFCRGETVPSSIYYQTLMTLVDLAVAVLVPDSVFDFVDGPSRCACVWFWCCSRCQLADKNEILLSSLAVI